MQGLNRFLIVAAGLVLLLATLVVATAPSAASPGETPSPLPTMPPTPSPPLPLSPSPTPSSTPPLLPSPPPTLPPTPTPTPTPLPFPIPTYPPNERGDIMVLSYHRIDRPEGRWTRTPEDFRRDLELLLRHGYYPVNLIDVVDKNLDYVPSGRRPVVITFDDATAGQFRYLADGTIDPNSAVGIMLAMNAQYGDAHWPMRATFFVMISRGEKPGTLFRQPDYAVEKAQKLVAWGMEIGSHSVTHPNFGESGAETIRWELAVSQARLEALLPGYRVRSFCPPYGAFPADRSLLRGGHSSSAGLDYSYDAVVRAWGGPVPSPYTDAFDPHFIPRIQVTTAELERRIAYYDEHPERYYVSDGGLEEADRWRYERP